LRWRAGSNVSPAAAYDVGDPANLGVLVAAQRTFARARGARVPGALHPVKFTVFDAESPEGRRGRARLLSCKTGVGGLLLDTLPTNGRLIIGSGAFVVGLRLGLGLSQAPPGDPTPACNCAGRLSRPDHAMAGPLPKSTMTPRHVLLKGAWFRINRRAGVAALQETTLPALRRCAPQHDRIGRDDVLLVMPDALVVGNDLVIHPAADTYGVAAARKLDAAAAQRDREKRRKYDTYGAAQATSSRRSSWRRTGVSGARRWRRSTPWRTWRPRSGGCRRRRLCGACCARWPSLCAGATP
jgi:hypothetical protein